MKVKLYKAPNGQCEEITMNNIRSGDQKFFEDGGHSVSMEELSTGAFVLYSTTGLINEDDEEHEELYVVLNGQSCEAAMGELRKRVEWCLRGWYD